MMDEAHSQSEQFLQHIETMTTALLDMETQCKVGLVKPLTLGHVFKRTCL